MKRYIKKISFVVIALGLSYGSMNQITLAKDTSFKDVPSTYWGYSTIQWGIQHNIVKGYSENSFKPNAKVSQQEFLSMLIRAYSPSDLKESSNSKEWSQPYLNYAKKLGWSHVASTSKDAKNELTRGEVAQYLANASGHNYNTDDSINYLLEEGLATGKVSSSLKGFQKNDPVTRTESIVFIKRLMQGVNKLNTSPAKQETYTSQMITYTNNENKFKLKLPKNWKGKYEVLESLRNKSKSIDFVDKEAKKSGGVVFSIILWPAKDWKNDKKEVSEQVPVSQLGELDNYVYLLIPPTDVQYDPNNKEMTKAYKNLYNNIPLIKENFQIIK